MEDQEIQTPANKEIVYTLPGMEKALVRKDIPYKTIDDLELMLDVYYPANSDGKTHLPAVIFIHGDGSPEQLKHTKDWGQYVGWGQLIAASGMIAVVANHRSSEALRNVVGVANDIDDLISYVRDRSTSLLIDSERLGIWTCSGGGYFGLRAALLETPPYIQALVCYYSFLEMRDYYEALYSPSDDEIGAPPIFDEEDFTEFSAIDLLLRASINETAPIFIARAGLDFPELNEGLDSFIDEALSQNINLTLMNHSTGQHGFDIQDNDARSHEIIQATLAFLAAHLLE
jgi:acetyl esterase/lipase